MQLIQKFELSIGIQLAIATASIRTYNPGLVPFELGYDNHNLPLDVAFSNIIVMSIACAG